MEYKQIQSCRLLFRKQTNKQQNKKQKGREELVD